MQSAPRAPAPPDYAAAATAQGNANVAAATAGASLSNPNIVSPYGNQTVTYGNTGPNGLTQPTITQTLTPAAQATLDAQQGVGLAEANLAQQGIGTASDVLSKPFNPELPPVQTSLGQPGELQGAVTPGSLQGSATQGQFEGAATPGAMQGAATPGSLQSAPDPSHPVNYGPDASQYQASGYLGPSGRLNSGSGPGPSAQGRLDTSGIAQQAVNAGMTGQQAILSRLEPQLQRNEAANYQRLANQGLAPGSEAFNNAMTDQSQNRNDLETQAALQGIGLDQSANNQGFNQLATQAGLYNSALGQNFNQGQQAAQLQNATTGQRFNQNLQAGQFANQAQAQNFGQAAQAAGLYNTAQNQDYGQQFQNAQFNNQNQQTAFNQGNTAAGINNANQATAFNQGLAGSQFNNQNTQANFDNSNTAAAFNNANQGTAFNQGMQGVQLNNANQGTQFNQGLQGGQFSNQAISQALQQALALRNQPLNEITALMSGSQIQNPQFQQYTGQNVAPAPVFQGVQQGAQDALTQYGIQANQAATNNAGLFGLAAAPFSMFNIGGR